MSSINKLERATQDRVIKLFTDLSAAIQGWVWTSPHVGRLAAP